MRIKFSITKRRKQVAVLYISTLIGTLLGVLSSIVNTRFLNPEDYGDVRYVQNWINLIATFLLFGYFWSGSRLLAISRSEDESRRIRGVMILVLVVCSMVLMFSVGILALVFRNQSNVSSLFLLSMFVCTQPLLSNYINTTAQGDNHIIRMAIARLVPSLLYVPIAFFIFSTFGASSRLLMLLQWGIYTAVFLIIIISTNPSFKNLKPVFKTLNTENQQYGLQLYYGSLIMLASNYLAGVTLGWFNDDNANVGFYTLALTVTSPLSALPAIIGTSYFKEFAKQDRIPDKVLKFTVIITVLSCIAFILLIYPLVVFLYSEEYSNVGTYASFLAFGFSIHGFGDMLNRYLGSHGQGEGIRNSSYICGLSKIIGFILLVYLWNINGAIITVVFSDILYAITMYYYYNKFISNCKEDE